MSRIGTFAGIVLLLAANIALGQVTYSVTDLGTLPGFLSSNALSINRNGQVVGNLWTGANTTGTNQAFLWQSGTGMQQINDTGGTSCVATAINNSGQIVGDVVNAGNPNPHPYFYSGGVMQTLPVAGTAMAINNNGQVVGYYSPDSTDLHPFLWQSGKALQDLGTFGGRISEATGINDSGQIAGWSQTESYSNQVCRAFLHSGGGSINLATDSLGTFGGNASVANAINNSGTIVGWSSDGWNAMHGFVHSGGGTLNAASDDLGTSAVFVNGINNLGQVVGSMTVLSGGDDAFIDYGNGSAIDLNDLLEPDSGWLLESAHGINDSGQIVGTGVIGGQTEAFLLNPIVPEPSTLALIAAGAAGLLGCGWRRRRGARTAKPAAFD